jgi:hypothetical protein
MMNPSDNAAIGTSERHREFPRTPGTVTGEQHRHGQHLIRLSWPNGQSAWLPITDVVPVAKYA